MPAFDPGLARAGLRLLRTTLKQKPGAQLLAVAGYPIHQTHLTYEASRCAQGWGIANRLFWLTAGGDF